MRRAKSASKRTSGQRKNEEHLLLIFSSQSIGAVRVYAQLFSQQRNVYAVLLSWQRALLRQSDQQRSAFLRLCVPDVKEPCVKLLNALLFSMLFLSPVSAFSIPVCVFCLSRRRSLRSFSFSQMPRLSSAAVDLHPPCAPSIILLQSPVSLIAPHACLRGYDAFLL